MREKLSGVNQGAKVEHALRALSAVTSSSKKEDESQSTGEQQNHLGSEHPRYEGLNLTEGPAHEAWRFGL
ncbi:hypothetical protein M1615_02925 [Patescibacteria group bacterium]|nr:hypothetical protein [Patescibacteria group bacterium]